MPTEVEINTAADAETLIRAQVANEIADWIMEGVADEAHGGELLKLTLARQIRKRYA